MDMLDKVKHIKHRLAHLLSMQYGYVTTWYNEYDELMVGFRCRTCRELSGVHKAKKD